MTREVAGKRQIVFEHNKTPVNLAKSRLNTFQVVLEDGVVYILLKEFYSKGGTECTLCFADQAGKIIASDDRFQAKGQYNNIGFVLSDAAIAVEPNPEPEPPKPEPPTEPEEPPCTDCEPKEPEPCVDCEPVDDCADCEPESPRPVDEPECVDCETLTVCVPKGTKQIVLNLECE